MFDLLLGMGGLKAFRFQFRWIAILSLSILTRPVVGFFNVAHRNYFKCFDTTVPIEIVGDTNIDGNNGSGRRVLGLIKTLNESFSDYDFLSPVWKTVKYEATAIAEGDLKAATLMANLITQHTSRESTCDSHHEGLYTRTSPGLVHFLPNRDEAAKKVFTTKRFLCSVRGQHNTSTMSIILSLNLFNE